MASKTSAQPGRRTPLSLSGKQPQQIQRTPSSSNDNTNSRTNNQKTEQKPAPEVKDIKKTPQQQSNDKKTPQQQNVEKKTPQQQNAEKKTPQQQNAEKKTPQSQNVEKKTPQQQNSKIPTSSNAQTKKPDDKKTQNGNIIGNVKDKQQQNGKDTNTTDNAKKEKVENVEKNEKVTVNADKNEKHDKEKQNELEKSKKLEPDTQEGNKIEIDEDKDLQTKPQKETRSKQTAMLLETAEKKKQTEDEEMSVCDTENSSAPSTPTSSTKSNIGSKQTTPVKPPRTPATTPKKVEHKTSIAAPVPLTQTVPEIIVIDDVDMEPLSLPETPEALPEPEPVAELVAEPIVAPILAIPAATSTPGKVFRRRDEPKSEVKLTMQPIRRSPDRSSCPRTFSQISGRRGIRPANEYTPAYYQSNTNFRESYRKINTELDVTSNTNTSLNVTVGSEVPNNFSFSFFGRGRKRERTPANSQSTIDLQGDLEISPKSPKRARMDMHGFFSVVASPLTMLRSRFSKTTIQSSTPMKLQHKLETTASDEEECGEVQNVSGISMDEEIHNGSTTGAAADDATDTEDVTVGNEASEDTPKKGGDIIEATVEDAAAGDTVKCELKFDKCGMENAISADDNMDDIKITETLNAGTVVGDPSAKNKRCSVM